ncbi:MAG: Holliday junction branch migration protein RuvA [Micavibrio aeruginosavorus]|uniref:Holliday junction branch migration complex subunit RuvA n=1 Tax=Micavibrio aeruginosavorus TaxID=349221 RepID=A0A2W5MSB1_9BACT|nr:MAG: Holliday junction branch migration protein RuvA [Micavibrio aeruginosavorus]
MIGKLSGIIDGFGSDYILLDVSGVGYLVHCSPRTLQQCGQTGDPASFLIDTHVREDAINLYGFKDAMEQQWFRLLTSVQGVGARVGMAILGACPAERLGFAIASGDKAAIQAADGVGPKLALRIVTELKDKAGKIDLQMSAPKLEAKISGKSTAPASVDQDAVSALVNLGYAKTDAFQAVLQAKQKAENDNIGLSDIIRLALKELSA